VATRPGDPNLIARQPVGAERGRASPDSGPLSQPRRAAASVRLSRIQEAPLGLGDGAIQLARSFDPLSDDGLRLGEDVVATASPLVEAEAAEPTPQSLEGEVGIARAAQNLAKECIPLGRDGGSPTEYACERQGSAARGRTYAAADRSGFSDGNI